MIAFQIVRIVIFLFIDSNMKKISNKQLKKIWFIKSLHISNNIAYSIKKLLITDVI